MNEIHEMIRAANVLLNDLFDNNQFLIATVVGAASVLVGYLLRTLPMKIGRFIFNQSITQMRVTNAGWNNMRTFVNLSRYLHEHCDRRLTRRYSAETQYDYDEGEHITHLAIGMGWHRVRFEGRSLFVHRAEMPDNHADSIKESIEIYALGRSNGIFARLLEQCKPAKAKGVQFHEWDTKAGEWRAVSSLKGRGLDSLALDRDVRDLLVREFTTFLEERETILSMGLPHKFTAILHGIPGSGKTSILRALAVDFELNLFSINLGSLLTVTELSKALNNVSQRSLVVMEDFDDSPWVKSRGNMDTIHKKPKSDDDAQLVDEDNAKRSREFEMLSFLTSDGQSAFFNLLDGIAPLDNVMIFMTTNKALDLDRALIRPGRIDCVIDIPPPSQSAVRDHLLTVWPELNQRDDMVWSSLPGCILYKIKRIALKDADKAAEMINYYGMNPDKAVDEQNGELAQLDRLRQIRKELLDAEADKKEETLDEVAPAASKAA